jgi:hypothetical protein
MSLIDALLLDAYPFEIWLAMRTDGQIGSGTLNDPYDGSTASRFDKVMSELIAPALYILGREFFSLPVTQMARRESKARSMVGR